MFQNILDDIVKKADELYCDLNKNIIDFNESVIEDIYNYKNINENEIDSIKSQLINKISYYIKYSKLDSLFNQSSDTYTDDTDEDQFINILNNSEYDIFKLKNLYSKPIQDYLNKTDTEIKDTLYDIFIQYDIFNKNYNNVLIKEFVSNIYNKNNNLIDKQEIKDKQYIKNEDMINIVNIVNIINSLFDELKDIKNIEYKLIDETDLLWDENVLIYKIINKKTYEYRYIFFDLFERQYKTENNIIINLSKNNVCFNKNYKYIKNEEINDIKNLIEQI
jgi:hypothetical protein